MYVLWVFIVNLLGQKSSEYFWKYFCLKSFELGEHFLIELIWCQKVLKWNTSQNQLIVSITIEVLVLQHNKISTANISHLYSCNLHTTQLISQWSVMEEKYEKKMFYGQDFEGEIICKFESILYDFYFQNRSVWWYTFWFC